jgi:SNF2 family DNA or RNA helicase
VICKDTIEEKIMQLQEDKKELAGELIGEDGFVKGLTEEDVEWLLG